MKFPESAATALVFLTLNASALCAATEQPGDSPTLRPGDKRLKPIAFEPYEAKYTSRSSTTGSFTLLARMVDRGSAISLIDMIPMKDVVIVAQRQVDAKTQAVQFEAGPLFSWGEEYVVRQMDAPGYDWTRIPIGGGAPVRSAGEFSTASVVSDMFSPTLAALWPFEVGETFQLPTAVPRKGGTVDSWWEEYRVLRAETLQTPSGETCACMVLEKQAPGGGVTHLWVANKPPYVFRRNFDAGGRREFVSDLVEFRFTD